MAEQKPGSAPAEMTLEERVWALEVKVELLKNQLDLTDQAIKELLDNPSARPQSGVKAAPTP